MSCGESSGWLFLSASLQRREPLLRHLVGLAPQPPPHVVARRGGAEDQGPDDRAGTVREGGPQGVRELVVRPEGFDVAEQLEHRQRVLI